MAIEEMFTSLPTVSTATMSDIICAVQGSSVPANLGLSVQETLGQVYSLFQSNIILYNAGNPNGAVAGTTYQLCWDTTNMILYVCITTGIAALAVWTKVITLTAGTGISISQAANNITIAANGLGTPWNNATTSTTMVSNNGYMANSSSLVSLLLPASSSFGDVLYIIGQGSGGWSITENSGQNIIMGSIVSTTSSGSVSSTNRYDSITLLCTVANTTWTTLAAPQGNLTIV